MSKDHVEPLYVGVDDGYRDTNIVLSDGRSIRINSQVKSGKQNTISIAGGEQSVYQYNTEEGSFIVGAISESDSISSDVYPVSSANRVLVAHALKSVGVTPNDAVVLVSGLPLKRFYVNNKVNKRLVESKMANLMKSDVTFDQSQASGSSKPLIVQPTIVRHRVVPEGVAAWMDYVMQRDKDTGAIYQDEQRLTERVAVIDIGGRTTDIAVVLRGDVNMSKSSTIEAGMLAIEEYVKNAIHEEYDFEPSLLQMNQLMATRKLTAWGEQYDVSSIIDDACKIEVERIRAEVVSRLGSASDVDRVLFVGGTTAMLGEYLEGLFRHQIVVDDPAFANARGMCKFAEFIS
ncbi:plasmid segregation protein ParM domain-containing protein [Vibrio breoganii]